MVFCKSLVSAIMYVFFFFNDTATTEIYTLSLHDALPICDRRARPLQPSRPPSGSRRRTRRKRRSRRSRSEEHTSELQSQSNLVCRLLLEKKKKETQAHMPLRSNRYRTMPTSTYENDDQYV